MIIDAIVVSVPVPGDRAVQVTLWRDGMVVADEIGDESCADGTIDWAAVVGDDARDADARAATALVEATPRLVALARGVFGEDWGTVPEWVTA